MNTFFEERSSDSPYIEAVWRGGTCPSNETIAGDELDKGRHPQRSLTMSIRKSLVVCLECGCQIDKSKKRGEPKRFFPGRANCRFYRNTRYQKRDTKEAGSTS